MSYLVWGLGETLMKKYRPRDTYKYQVLVGNKVVHYGITDNLSQLAKEPLSGKSARWKAKESQRKLYSLLCVRLPCL